MKYFFLYVLVSASSLSAAQRLPYVECPPCDLEPRRINMDRFWLALNEMQKANPCLQAPDIVVAMQRCAQGDVTSCEYAKKRSDECDDYRAWLMANTLGKFH